MQKSKRPDQTAPEEELDGMTGQPDVANQDDAAAEPTTAERAGDPIADIEARLREAEARAAEHHEAWLRAKAETENVRRRSAEEALKAGKFAIEKFANAMLPVRDSLETALGTENQNLESLREGVELTLKQLESAFDSAGLKPEHPEGQRFDPNLHEAISAIEADAEPNTVVNVLQKGYVLHERVIRPALVVVSKPKG